MEQLDYDYLAKLVKKTKEGDSNAFAELYTATYKNQYRFAYQYVKDSFLAQDILQDLYIVVLKNIQSLKNPRFFVSWLHQICFRLCFDAAKKAKKEAEELVYEDLSQADALPPHTHKEQILPGTRNTSFFWTTRKSPLWRRSFPCLLNMPKPLLCVTTTTWALMRFLRQWTAAAVPLSAVLRRPKNF